MTKPPVTIPPSVRGKHITLSLKTEPLSRLIFATGQRGANNGMPG